MSVHRRAILTGVDLGVLRFQCFFRQRINRFAAKLKSGSVRLPVREALAFTAFYGERRTFTIRDVASVVAEIKLGQIPVQVLFFAVLIVAAHTALEDAEIAFNGVGRHVAASIFASARA